MAAAFAPPETEEDIVSPNIVQNILVVSTPEKKNATAYAAIQQIRRTTYHGGQNVQRTLSSSLRRATEKVTARFWRRRLLRRTT
ncbi:hypothetical protein HPB52_001239 [Rhipicephalus sanguineus]|uniref:Uncharacterized protein n=1 Tax=Rhipicephalus sanguineus TaxID=34632 RepID=A0A9D4PTL1_RHISA|nr:hypothetical protein HPB52_001239 [Rhipicephalus sanguineus]